MEIQDAFPTSQQQPQPNQHQIQDVRLPRIELPTFDGDFSEWVSFRDMFVATVHDSTLSGAKKMQNLKSSLKGNAANLIKSMQITEQDYDQAWATIKERYDNTREMITSILQRLFSQPISTKESSTSLQRLLDTTNECRRSLIVLGRPVDTWDDLLVYMVVERMDPESRRRWTMQLKHNQIPTYKEWTLFMENYLRGLVAGGQAAGSSTSKPHHQQFKSSSFKKTSSHQATTASITCPVCSRDHAIYKCEKFLSLSVSERSMQVKKLRLCFNCLKANHAVKECKSKFSCKKCTGRHNSLLHTEDNPQNSDKTDEVVSMHTSNQHQTTQVLLATAVVAIQDNSGAMHQCRVLMDSGSQSSFVSESCVAKLGLCRSRCNITVCGIGETPSGTVRGMVQLQLQSRFNSSAINVTAYILPKVTGTFPRLVCSTSWGHISKLQLADPRYYEPTPIDVLLGADHFASVMRGGRRVGTRNTPIAQETIFGWILSGQVSASQQQMIQVHVAKCETEDILQKFWEIEELPAIKHLTSEEERCEDSFQKTHARDESGRYVVSLPTNSRLQFLGKSRDTAVSRFLQVEKRLARHPEMKQDYIKFMREFKQLNHMEVVPVEQLNQPQGKYYYLPHHCVLKASSTSTKLRVVFDGSCKTSSGVSLNDCILVGPTVQDDLLSLLLRFRLHLVALKADISKMYRQFKISEDQPDLQRIVWRESADQPLVDYRIQRVTYGTASAPFLATRCLKQLSVDGGEKYPVASSILANDFYVDDLLSGTASSAKAITLQRELTELLQSGGMELCKWSSNDQDVLEAIPATLRETNLPLSLDPESATKALGVQWHPTSDTFQFQAVPQKLASTTKRACLSELAKTFDPLGLLSPTTIRAKILFQDSWKRQLSWDEHLPEDLQQQWNEYMQQLKVIENIQIPRCVVESSISSVQVHGFSDASEKAYSAVIYLRSQRSDGSFTSRLVTAKTKVAPLKQVSLPRLELCGALLLARLFHTVKNSISFGGPVYAWTDSTIVLQWLAATPSRWKTFVAIRVSEIQNLVPVDHWHHVKSEQNPADCASRGISAVDLKDFQLWWHGPEWLCDDDTPNFSYTCNQKNVQSEARKEVVRAHVASIMVEPWSLIEKYSTLNRLIRVTAYVFRFIHRITRQQQKYEGELSVDELQKALHFWMRHAQELAFADEIRKLDTKRKVKASSKLLTLTPFIDENGLLRVGGRLQKSEVPESYRHQIILPNHHRLTTLVILHHHLLHLHAAPQLLLSTLQQQYWIIHGRNAVRAVTRACVVCRRHRAQTSSQLMGSLPAARVTPSRPFLKSGTDYAGPINLKVVKGRNQKSFKAYICLFVCMSTKAVHLEAVSELTTDAFIAALKRFSSRRGVSSDLFSDCGTNYVGANAELTKMLASANHNNKVSKFLADHGTQWHFNAPGAPHHGGLWEAGVKAVKYHLRRVIGSSVLNFEELQTLLCQVEACLNSRPLCATSSDPADYSALTPAHFLIGQPFTAVPEGNLIEIPVNRLSRWQLQQQMLQHFWKRWSTEYLATLQQRHKWTTNQDNVHVNDLVIIKEENVPPMKWKLARITEVHPGQDRCVRVVTVKTSTGEFKRPITKICPLIEAQNDLNNK